jgi:flagellar hook-length control protein FliK
MSPERTNNVTSLPVRPDRSQRADQQAPASDFFATLLDAHADRADRAPSRRERQPSDDGPRDRRPVDRPARPDRPADVPHRKPAPAAEHPTSEPATTDEPTPADKAAAAAAASAMLGLLAAVTPQPPAATAQAPTQTAPVVEEPTVAAQTTPVVTPQAEVVGSVVAAQEGAVAEPQVPATEPVVGVATVEGAETAGIEGTETEAPAQRAMAAVATEEAVQTPVAGRASVADSGNTRPGDRRSEGVSGDGAEARPSAQAPVNARPAAQSGGAASQGDQRQSDTPAPRVTTQAAQPTPQPQTQRVDVSPLAGVSTQGVQQGAEPKGAATLAQAPRAVGQLIHLASERGVQHARLNLKPVELGGIEIRLIASSAGVTAHVVADSPEAARLLQ